MSLTAQVRQQRLALNAALGLPPETQVPLQKGVGLPDQPRRPDAAADPGRPGGAAARPGGPAQGLREPGGHAAPGRAGAVPDDQHRPERGARHGQRDHGRASASRSACRSSTATRAPSRGRRPRGGGSSTSTSTASSRPARRSPGCWTTPGASRSRSAWPRQAEPGLQQLVDTYRQAVAQGQADVLSYYTAWNDLTAKRLEVLVPEAAAGPDARRPGDRGRRLRSRAP